MDAMKKGAADMMKKTGTPMPAKKKNPSLTDLANLVKNKTEAMDPVGKADADIDNDGDVDHDSDE